MKLTFHEESMFDYAAAYGGWVALAEELIREYDIIARLRAGEDLGHDWWVVAHAFRRAGYALHAKEGFLQWAERAREERKAAA